ncbi:MAG: DUF1667 domain-containing protein [Clostridia bacterium]|nr:DUF1667 domain-containing protein [Clostridia bacterium]
MTKEIICTVCPTGCRITVEGEGTQIANITGNGCKRGIQYATDEFILPKRILTCSVKLQGADRGMLPVRSSCPLPLESVFDCMKVIKATEVAAPVKVGQVIVKDILGLGVDMISAMSIEKVGE